MKKLISLLMLSAVCLLFVQSKPVAPAYRYYFCFSKEVPRFDRPEKLKMIYTDIRTAKGDTEEEMQTVIQKFGKYVDDHCKQPINEFCTSDLNKYPTLEQAKKRHQEIIDKYKKDQQYAVSRIDFKEFE